MVREARAADAGEIAGIYNFFVERTAVSFEETAVTAPEVAARMDGADGYPWLVWEEAGAAAGFACLRRWQQRAAYRRAAEVAVYVRRGRERRGIGSALLARLLEEARRRDIHALVSVITVPNAGSVALHEKFGFRQAGCLREIGWKLGRWRDVGYWELLLGGGGGGGDRVSGAAGTVLGTVLLAFLPISELRGAIPFAAARGLPWFAAYPLAVCVNALAAPACWLFLSTAHRLFYGAADGGGAGEAGGGGLRWYRRLFDRFVARARERLRPGVERWGWFGLALFVAVPLPVTGAWTGTLGAWVLGLGRRRTLAAVFLGVLISGAVVTAVTVLGVKALGVFTKQG